MSWAFSCPEITRQPLISPVSLWLSGSQPRATVPLKTELAMSGDICEPSHQQAVGVISTERSQGCCSTPYNLQDRQTPRQRMICPQMLIVPRLRSSVMVYWLTHHWVLAQRPRSLEASTMEEIDVTGKMAKFVTHKCQVQNWVAQALDRTLKE